MTSKLKTFISNVISATPLQYAPVRVRHGLAKGARWTLAPFSANWRLGGGECDVASAVTHLDKLEGKVFWDFGAHYGIHTVGMAMQVGATGQVASFEPDPTAFVRLQSHVLMNSLANVRLYRAAASDEQGDVELYLPGGRQGSSCSHIKYYAENDMNGVPSIVIKKIVPDELTAAGDIRLPDLIKVDVQGHGARALAGSIKSIITSRPIIVFSNHSEAEMNGARALLEPLGYVTQSFTGKSITWGDAEEFLIIPQ